MSHLSSSCLTESYNSEEGKTRDNISYLANPLCISHFRTTSLSLQPGLRSWKEVSAGISTDIFLGLYMMLLWPYHLFFDPDVAKPKFA